ncbi:MAG TPA: class F sortase [Streptomyces sp.]|nr:class F sortase [Streptomyces sp.]
MTGSTRPAGIVSAAVRTRRRVLTAAVLATTLGTTLFIAGALALLPASHRPPIPAGIGTVEPSAPGPPASTAPIPSGGVAPPVRISAAGIGLRSSLTNLHVQPDGHLGTPSNPGKAGWWSEGPIPGGPGAAVIVGHVDSRTGPAVFHNLSSLRPGDKITLHRRDGSTATFAVRALRQYAKDKIPDDQVYVLDGPPALRLITCGGTYDRGRQEYSDNLVVYADFVQSPAAPQHRS